MKIIRSRAYTMETGKYSIWWVCLSAREIERVAKKHPEHKTYAPVTGFRVLTNGQNNGVATIHLLRDYKDYDSIVRTLVLKANYQEEADDAGTTEVTFTSETPFSTNVPDAKKEKTFKLQFKYDFLGYVSGSFYLMFDAVIRGAEFASVDGSKILGGSEEAKGYTQEMVDELMELKKQIKVVKLDEYDKRAKILAEKRAEEKAKKEAEEKAAAEAVLKAAEETDKAEADSEDIDEKPEANTKKAKGKKGGNK